MDTSFWTLVAAIGTPILYLLGALSAIDAMLRARTAQGATAWVIALALAAPVALPVYWIFGRSRFEGYVEALRELDAGLAAALAPALDGELAPLVAEPSEDARTASVQRGFAAIASFPFLRGNGARLLIDGRETFDAIFEAIDRAERYLLVQFYIVHDDDLGRELRDRLVRAASRGVAVWFLYDEIGSASLPRAYTRSLSSVGVRVAGFGVVREAVVREGCARDVDGRFDGLGGRHRIGERGRRRSGVVWARADGEVQLAAEGVGVVREDGPLKRLGAGLERSPRWAREVGAGHEFDRRRRARPLSREHIQQHEPPAGADEAEQALEGRLPLGQRRQAERAQHAVHVVAAEGLAQKPVADLARLGAAERDTFPPVPRRALAAFSEHPARAVHTEDGPALAHGLRQPGEALAGPAREVQHAVSGREGEGIHGGLAVGRVEVFERAVVDEGEEVVPHGRGRISQGWWLSSASVALLLRV